jgi:hypothetical protein
MKATGTDRGSVPKDQPTPATTHPKAVYEVLRSQRIPHKVNGSPCYRHPPKFSEFKDVTWRATKLVFAKAFHDRTLDISNSE